MNSGARNMATQPTTCAPEEQHVRISLSISHNHPTALTINMLHASTHHPQGQRADDTTTTLLGAFWSNNNTTPSQINMRTCPSEGTYGALQTHSFSQPYKSQTLINPAKNQTHTKRASLPTMAAAADLVTCSDEMPRLINFLSSLLEKVAESNDMSRRFHPQKISVFHGLTKPTISIQSYLERIFKYANCSPSCFVVAYVYLDRFVQRQPSLPINTFNVHRLLITSVMVAAKFMDDMYYNNAYYAKVGGISTAEMNFLEVDFLFGLSFHLNVTPKTFHTYCSYLQREMTIMDSPSLASCININSSLSAEYESVLDIGRSLKLQLCFKKEDDQTSKQQQQHQQLAV